MKIISSILLLSFISCNSNWNNYGGYKMEYDSSIDYYITIDKGEVVYGTSKADLLKKGTLIKYHKSSGKIDSTYMGRGGIVIQSFVDKRNVAFNDKFLLVAQKPLDSIFGIITYDGFAHRKINPTKELLDKSNFYKYWIIEKKDNNIYGPYTKQEYSRKKTELKVAENLRIDIE